MVDKCSVRPEFGPINILSIETVLGKCSVALKYQGSEDFLVTKEDFVQSEMLFVLIEALFDKHKAKFENLNAISCTTGPGSFTGIRAGIIAIRTIQTLLPHITALGINTLEVVAFAGLPISKAFRETNLILSDECPVAAANREPKAYGMADTLRTQESAKVPQFKRLA